MVSVLLAIDIILAIGLTILVLLQRSEGGALGALGGGGGNSMFTGRQTGNMLTRLTWWMFALFVIVNLTLVVVSKKSTVEAPVSLIPTEQSAPTAQAENAPVVPLDIDGKDVNIEIEAPQLPEVPRTPEGDPVIDENAVPADA